MRRQRTAAQASAAHERGDGDAAGDAAVAALADDTTDLRIQSSIKINIGGEESTRRRRKKGEASTAAGGGLLAPPPPGGVSKAATAAPADEPASDAPVRTSEDGRAPEDVPNDDDDEFGDFEGA